MTGRESRETLKYFMLLGGRSCCCVWCVRVEVREYLVHVVIPSLSPGEISVLRDTAIFMDHWKTVVSSFSVYRVDHLYTFFVQWSPEIYGKDAKEQGFVVVEKEELDMIDNFFSEPTTKSWEVGAFCHFMNHLCINCACPVKSLSTCSFDNFYISFYNVFGFA